MLHCRGFTLLEALITLVIIATLTGVALPAMGDFLDKQKADATAYQITRQLNSARKFAVTSNRRATFCGVNRDGVCIREDIKQFAVFADRNDNQRIDDEDEVHARFDVDWPGTVLLHASNARHITFRPDGSAIQWGRIVLCPFSGNARHNRRVTVQRAGRPYLATDRDAAGVVTDTEKDCAG